MYSRLSPERFVALAQSCAAPSSAAALLLHEQLMCAWAEPHRAYHSQQHLAECLELLDTADDSLPRQQQAVIELALWFHDAVYDVRAHDNEEQSADWAVEALSALELPPTIVSEVARLVLATRHLGRHEPGTDELVSWMLDIDLAILGADPARFAQYEQQIRLEYGWVPDADYTVARARVMQHFATQARAGTLYRTAWARALLLPKALRNLPTAN